MTPNHRALTRAVSLMDLLAIVAVIAVSLTLVVPTLAKMKEPSRRSMCVDNLHRLAQGVFAYASDHQGKGPMRGYFSYDVTEYYHEAGWGGQYTKVPVNLGMLYKKWIGGQSDMLYCPLTYTTVRDNPSYGWKTAFDPAVTWTIGSYNYGIPLAERASASPTFVGTNPFPPVLWSQGFLNWIQYTWQPRNPGATFVVPSSPALVFDMWIGGLKPVHGPGVNVMYMDGHVRYHDIGGIAVGSGSSMQYDIWYKVSLQQ